MGFKGFGKDPIRAGFLIGVEGFEGSLGFNSVIRGLPYIFLCVGEKWE